MQSRDQFIPLSTLWKKQEKVCIRIYFANYHSDMLSLSWQMCHRGCFYGGPQGHDVAVLEKQTKLDRVTTLSCKNISKLLDFI